MAQPNSTQKIQCTLDAVRVGVNRVTGALDWGAGGLLAYGAHHMAAIYDAQAAEVRGTLIGHTGMVTCVRWVDPAIAAIPGAQLLLTGSADGTLRVWAVRTESAAAIGAGEPLWEALAVLEGHSTVVTDLCAFPLPASEQPQGAGASPSFLVASCAGDGQVHIWLCNPSGQPTSNDGSSSASGVAQQQYQQYSQGAWSLAQKVSSGSHIQHAVAMTYLPGAPDWLILATGGTDSRLHLHLRPPGGSFQPAAKLSGHENWVRSLAFCHVSREVSGSDQSQAPELILASASQDRYGRIWCITPEQFKAGAPASGGDNVLAAIMSYAPNPVLVAGDNRFTVTLESLLVGHEDWVHTVRWQPVLGAKSGQGSHHTPPPTRSDLCLLTASMDRTMVLWTYEPKSRLWMNVASVGDAGASCLGYFGGLFSPDAHYIIAHGFTGALHLWEQQQDSSQSVNGGVDGAEVTSNTSAAQHSQSQPGHTTWVPRHSLGGHWDSVAQVGWGIDGGVIGSVSLDQTARLWAATAPSGLPSATGSGTAGYTASLAQGGHWCEIARPQIHGHDFSCFSFLPHGTPAASYAYVCGSEEKVLRVLEAPQAFLDTLDLLRKSGGGATSPSEAEHPALLGCTGTAAAGSGAPGASQQESANAPQSQPETRRARAFGAAVSALGLTNKAVQQGDVAGAAGNAGVGSGMPGGGYEDGPDFVPNAMPSVVSGPPLEEHLAQNTLWPEAHKLYGHGDVLYCCAASPDGAYLASACIAKSSPQAAAIWIWDVQGSTWRGVTQLPAHTLTVTQLAWSRSGRFLASCSRDRTWAVHERVPPEQQATQGADSSSTPAQDSFVLRHRQRAAHARVIWGAAWSHDERLLATGGREGGIKIWDLSHITQGPSQASPSSQSTQAPLQPAVTLPTQPVAVTAVAFATVPITSAAQQGVNDASTGGTVYLLAVGLEYGAVQLWQISSSTGGSMQAEQVWESDLYCRHAAQVNSIAWRSNSLLAGAASRQDGRDVSSGAQTGVLQFATGSADHSVRVYTVGLPV